MSSVTTPSGQSVAYTDHGGNGPVVVFLHAFLMDGRMFQPQVDTLRDRYRCVTVDLRGHGDTPSQGEDTYWDIAADVLAVLDALGIGEAFVAGTSQGGFVALRIALQAPDRVRGLVLMGTSAAAENPESAAAYRGLADVWLQNGPSTDLVDLVAAICFGDQPMDDWKARWLTVSGEHLAHITEVLAGRDSLLDRLGEVRGPVLVLHGDSDRAYPVTEAEHIVDGVPGAWPLVVVPNGAHFLSLTDAADVTPRIERFLADHA